MKIIETFLRQVRRRIADNARERRNYRAMIALDDDILKDIGCRREDVRRFF